MAEGKTGPGSREVAEVRHASEPEDITFTNQCLFIQTINHLLPDDVWERLEAAKPGTIKTAGSAEYGSSSNAGKGKAKANHSAPRPHDPHLIALNQLVDSSSNFTTSLVCVDVIFLLIRSQVSCSCCGSRFTHRRPLTNIF